jgi:hypothetical protein
LLDDPVILYIPVGKKADHEQRYGEKAEQGNAHDGIAGKQAALPAVSPALAAASSRRDFHLNGHGEGCASIHKSNSQSATDFRANVRL